MLEILKFIFSGFWIFFGFLLLFSVFCDAVVKMFSVFFEFLTRRREIDKALARVEKRLGINGEN
jgi:hypothetical protein